jgi:UTP-glucose-1-phosphate uridylyltransferase
MDAILPAAGLATRMQGIPKFLLPSSREYDSLIGLHIDNLIKHCERIWIPTRPDLVLLFDTFGFRNEKITILPMSTKTMSETITKVLSISKAETHFLCMPDTYFFGEKPYELLNKNPLIADVACWNIREDQFGKLGQVKVGDDFITDIKDKDKNCKYNLNWGCFTFSRDLIPFIDDNDPHLGYALSNALEDEQKIQYKIINGSYYDCGTPDEYLNMLKNVIN